MIGFHHLVNAEASVIKGSNGKWFSCIRIYDKDVNQVTFYTDDHEHKVQALMAVFDLVGILQAEVQRLADAEGMADLEASTEEATLIAGGTEALPELSMVEYTEKVLNLVSGSVMRSLEKDGLA